MALPNDDTEMTVHLSEEELKKIREELHHRINEDPLPSKEELLKKLGTGKEVTFTVNFSKEER